MDDKKKLEPVVLGKLRKERSSKPAFVVIVLMLILGTCFGLPYIQEYLKGTDNIINDIYEKIFGKPEVIGDETIVVDNDTIRLLGPNAEIIFDNNIILTNVVFDNNNLSYSIKVKTETLNLDEEGYYLEVYGSTNNFLRRAKLTGTISTIEEVKVSHFTDLKFNSGSSYYGRIQKIETDKYEDITLTSDESGLADLICTNTANNYTYIFDNHALIKIKHRYTYSDISDLTIYMQKYNISNSLTKTINVKIPGASSTEETNEGFVYNANLDLNKISRTDLGEYIDYNYYDLNTAAKVVNYEMKAKGYECK